MAYFLFVSDKTKCRLHKAKDIRQMKGRAPRRSFGDVQQQDLNQLFICHCHASGRTTTSTGDAVRPVPSYVDTVEKQSSAHRQQWQPHGDKRLHFREQSAVAGDRRCRDYSTAIMMRCSSLHDTFGTTQASHVPRFTSSTGRRRNVGSPEREMKECAVVSSRSFVTFESDGASLRIDAAAGSTSPVVVVAGPPERSAFRAHSHSGAPAEAAQQQISALLPTPNSTRARDESFGMRRTYVKPKKASSPGGGQHHQMPVLDIRADSAFDMLPVSRRTSRAHRHSACTADVRRFDDVPGDECGAAPGRDVISDTAPR